MDTHLCGEIMPALQLLGVPFTSAHRDSANNTKVKKYKIKKEEEGIRMKIVQRTM